MIKRLDNLLWRIGLMRKSRSPRIDYDFVTGQIFMEFANKTRIIGWVCPTPDGPLKTFPLPPNPIFQPPPPSDSMWTAPGRSEFGTYTVD